MRPLLLIAACSLLMAGDAPPATAAPAPAQSPAPQPAAKPYLGIAIDQAATTFDGKGLAILRVEPNSPAAVMGLVAGDRLTSLDGKALKSQDDLAASLADKKPGSQVQLEAIRSQGKDGLPQVLKLSGVLQEAPRSRVGSLGSQLSELQSRIADLNAKTKEPTLAEMLQKLQDVEKDLPRAAEAFKKVYPNGEFRIAISLEITSDKTSKNPLDIEVSGQPTDKPAEPPKPDATKADPAKPEATKPEPAKP